MLCWDIKKSYSPITVSKCDKSSVNLSKEECGTVINMDIYPLCQQIQILDSKVEKVIFNGQLELLTTIIMVNNHISDISWLQYVPNAQIVNISQNKTKTGQLLYFNQLQHLIQLALDDNSISTLDHLQSKSLQVLSLKNNRIKKIVSMSNLPNLVHLNLSNNRLTNVELLFFFKQLNTLDISSNPIYKLQNIHFLRALPIASLNFTECSFYIDSMHYDNLYICTFPNCTKLNNKPISIDMKIKAIRYFKVDPLLPQMTNLNSYDMIHKRGTITRVVLHIEKGTSYAHKLLQDAFMLFSNKDTNKVAIYGHQYVSWIDDSTLVVHSSSFTSSISTSDAQCLVFDPIGDDYDYNRLRTMLMAHLLQSIKK